MPVRVTDENVETQLGPRLVVIFELDEHVVVGRERLASTTELGDDPDALDLKILAQINRAAADRIPSASVFRGRSETGSWRFSDDLSDDELEEVACRVLMGNLQVWRRFVAMGIVLHVHAGWRRRERLAFQAAGARLAWIQAERLAAALDVGDAPTAGLARLDLWLSQRFLLLCEQSYDDVLKNLLPRHLPDFEGRRARVQRLLAGVDPVHTSTDPK